MKTAEKTRQKLAYSNSNQPNAKYFIGRRWKVNLNTIQDFVDYMEETNEWQD